MCGSSCAYMNENNIGSWCEKIFWHCCKVTLFKTFTLYYIWFVWCVKSNSWQTHLWIMEYQWDLRTRFWFNTHIFDLCKTTWYTLACSKQNFKQLLSSGTLRRRNHWDIWLSLHCRDWINSVRLNSWGSKWWPPCKF